MWQKLVIMMMVVSICGWVVAQPVGTSANPEMQKQPVKPKGTVTSSSAGTPPAEFTALKTAGKQTPSSQMSKYTKMTARPKDVGTAYVDPPYIQGWVQPMQQPDTAWVDGTGYIQTAEVQYGSNGFPNGNTFHTSGAYAYGKASSRCWVKCMFTPMKSGNYQVDVSAWQQGSLKGACGYGSQFYAYRSVGVLIENVGSQTKTAEELYFNQPIGTQTRSFNGIAVASKTFYLNAGQTYTVWGYTELGGWSSGDNKTWQTVDAVCYIGPFMFKGINIK